jgi:hypothetical protein
MNDFTKEELEFVSACVYFVEKAQFDEIPKKSLDFLAKIQSMIDNYCEHIWTDGSGNHIFCGKCNAHGGKR